MLNKESELILSNLYEYDFEACLYNMLNNIGYDLSNISSEDKTSRNILLGKEQNKHPMLKHVFIQDVNNLLQLYLTQNNIAPENVIWTQRDGVITTCPIIENNISMKFKFKNNILHLISTMKRDKILILYSNHTIDIKGVINKPIDLGFYELMLNIDFSNRKKIFEGCESIRQKILNSKNKNWFIKKGNDGKLTIPMKGDTLLTVNPSFINNINIDDIDKQSIYDTYVYPFIQTILICYNSN